MEKRPEQRLPFTPYMRHWPVVRDNVLREKTFSSPAAKGEVEVGVNEAMAIIGEELKILTATLGVEGSMRILEQFLQDTRPTDRNGQPSHHVSITPNPEFQSQPNTSK